MRKILFVELLGGLGDLVMALPAIHALALSHPEAELTVLTFAPGVELLAADPLVRRALTAERGDAAHPERPRQAVEALLRAESFDLLVSDTTYGGIGPLLESTGARAVANLWRHPPPDALIEERFLHILHQEGLIRPWTLDLKPRLALSPDDRIWAAARYQRPGRRALLHPHAGMPIKTWPAERFIALGQALRDECGLEIIVAAGNTPAEAAVARRIVRALGPWTELLPGVSLRRFAAAASCMDLVVGSDTGPVRVAAAVGARTTGLFGPTWHGRSTSTGRAARNAPCATSPISPARLVGMGALAPVTRGAPAWRISASAMCWRARSPS